MVSKANRRADEAELRLQQERDRNDAEMRRRRELYEQMQQELHENVLAELRSNSDWQRQRKHYEQQQQERHSQLLAELREERRQATAPSRQW